MPKKLPPKNSSWIQLTKDFVKEWPEILEGIQFRNLPIKYLLYCNIILKNNVTIHYDVKRALRTKRQESIARFLAKIIKQHYLKIKSVDLKFDIPTLKKDMESKTSGILNRMFRK